ncbi:MAG: nucleotidyltransferase substrate binding protein [Pseudohongiella sp.]|nr:nucleotidyltransferase substrate binding protein [Pseudohongiella sp.]MDP2282851.1 nucleotidyltransferase substrate binding protein [Pseudohongiella sp.]
MPDNKPSLESLQNSIQRLKEGLARYQHDVSDTQIRDGLVQRFEFTYELAHKTLKRYLEFASPSPELYDSMPFADLIRSANEQGLLLSDWPRWRLFREMRSKTSHTYDEEIAIEVVSGIPSFLDEANFLCDRLKEHLS